MILECAKLWIWDYYFVWRLRRWQQLRLGEQSTYTDSNGQQWNLANILSIYASLTVTQLEIDSLWQVSRTEQVWGTNLPNLEQAYEDVLDKGYLHFNIPQMFYHADLTGTWDDHLSRIAIFAYSLKRRRDIPPIILGADGRIWDGYHRLVAHRVVGKCLISAVLMLCLNPDSG